MKVASIPAAAAADGAGRIDPGDDSGGRHQQHLLKPGTLRSSSSTTDDDGASSTVASPLALSLLGRALQRTKALFMEPPSWLPLVVLLHNQVLFAIMHVIAKPALTFIPPFALAMMRISLAVPFLFFMAWKEGSLPTLTTWSEIPYLSLLGMVGVALPQTLIFVANRLAGPSIIAILSPAAPVYASIFAYVLKLERLTWVKAGGILLAVSGAFVVLRPDQMDFGQPTDMTAGVFVMILQTMSYAAFLVALKIRLATRPYPFGMYAYASLIGVCLIALFSFVMGLATFDAAKVPGSAWGAVVYCGVVVSFWAHACNSWALSKTSASIPALFMCLSPFLTGFLAYLVLGDSIGSATDVIGLALNVTGLLAVIYSKLRLETTPAHGGGNAGVGHGAPAVCPVQPMPSGDKDDGEEEDKDQEYHKQQQAPAQRSAAPAAPLPVVPAFIPGKLTSVPEEREKDAAHSAAPSPVPGAS